MCASSYVRMSSGGSHHDSGGTQGREGMAHDHGLCDHDQVGHKRKMENTAGGEEMGSHSDENLTGRLKRVHLLEPGLTDEDTAVDSEGVQAWANTLYVNVNRMLGEAHRDMLRRSQEG